MKRTILKKVHGNTGDREWFMLVLAEKFDIEKKVLHTEKSIFVGKTTFDAVVEGDEITVN